METFDAPLNTDKFIYYCEATQKKWSILSYIKTTSQFNAFCSALSRCSIVEEIDLSELPKLKEDNIKNLIAALESNSSLTSLKLFRGLPYDGDLMPLFDTLARKKQLRSLSISCREGSDNFVAVLHYCRNATEITNLSISNVTEQTGVQILDALEGHKNLNELSIGDADEWSHAGLGKLGNFLNRHKNIKKYYFFATSESIDFLSKFLDSTEVIDFAYAKSSDNIMEEGDEEEDVPTAKPVQIVSKEDPPFEHESNLTKLFLDLLPMEINRKILYSININNLMAVLRTCKRTMEICRSNIFWRDYYLTHFDCIPEEVFETVSVRYGDQLIGTNSIEDLKPTNFWYLALKAMKFIYNVPKTDMPQTKHPILQMATKMFPQLKYSYMMKIENDMVWFTADGSVDSDTYSAHRLGVQYQKEFNKYNAILLRKFNYIDHLYTNNPFDHILYILGWIQEENVEEFLEKLKPLAEMFTLLNYNNKYTSHAEIIPKRGLSDHFSNLDLTITATAKKIEEHVTKLLSDIEYNTQIDLQHLEQIITKFKNSIRVPVQVDYGLYKQKLPLRSDINAKKIYSYENRLYNFHNGEWDLDEHINKYWSKVSTTDLKTKHHRSAKKNATTEVMKLTRVIMNYIMMPLLRVFWPQNSKDVDYLKSNCSAHYALTTQYEQFYMNPYVPINSISIAKGYPKHWPAIAIGVSHLIVDQIFNVVDDIALNNNTEGSIGQLILALEKIGFYSKNALDEIRTFLLTVTNKTS